MPTFTPETEDTRAFTRVCGVPVHTCSHAAVLLELERNITGPRIPQQITITNTESMYYARRDPVHGRIIESARFSLCDGMGVVIAARLQRKHVARFNGPILMLKAAEYGAQRGWRHYFCGGREGVAETLSLRLTEAYPGLVTAGIFCPPFGGMSEEDEDRMVDAINAARPDLLWVGLGLLKQEAWIARFRDRLHVPWLIGVGAAFDYHAGTARWAPEPIRKIGFEWLYRLCFEPRMFVRNVRSFVFLLEGLIEAVVGTAPVLGGKRRDRPKR